MLQQDTIDFLLQLQQNNNRPWFDANKNRYLAAKEDFENYLQQVINEISKFEPGVSDLKPKDCMFRIYRDVRFRKDKRPYKNHLAARFVRGGKELHFPCFYLHVEPGGLSDFGGGIWHPAPEVIKKIRQEIDYNFDEFRSIIQAPRFKKMFGELDQKDKLVRPPKDYDVDNPAIEYLKLKNWFAGTIFQNDDFTSPALLEKTIKTFKTVKPLIDFLWRALD